MLLIHGLTRGAEVGWIEPGWPRALAAQGRGTIAVDLPGHGSCPLADAGAVSVESIIAAMVATIDSTGQGLTDGSVTPWAAGMPVRLVPAARPG